MIPIETVYAGYRFRSRLEARWAVFFSRFASAWKYEAQGYEYDGRRYLPDFTVKTEFPDSCFVEIKGDPAAIDSAKLFRFAEHADAPLLVLQDIPSPDSHGPHHQCIFREKGKDSKDFDHVLIFDVAFASTKSGQLTTIPCGWPRYAHRDKYGLFAAKDWACATRNFMRTIPQVVDAYGAARAARFEFGE